MEGIIQVLDNITINQIAAGEVIERPASVVKELVENAIDALATSVTVEIKDGGTSLIRITDNGSGIGREDIKKAFLRHATSKIRSAEDLQTVESLGFRGEALASIASIAMVEVITKQTGQLMGIRYEIRGEEEGEIEEVGVPDGTTFLVRNLFFNTPARKKFLKSNVTEAGYISDVVQHMAMAHPEVAFRFINNGKHMLNTSGNGSLKDVIYQIYGREIAANLIEVHFQDAGAGTSVDGYIGKPCVSRGNRNFENYFINGRFVRNKILNRGIEDGYKNFMMQHQYPFTALKFRIEPELIDVNVHPAKLEVRFRNGDILYPFVMKGIEQALAGREFIVEVTAEEKKSPEPLKREISKSPEIFETHRRQTLPPVVREDSGFMRQNVTETSEVKENPDLMRQNVSEIPEVKENPDLMRQNAAQTPQDGKTAQEAEKPREPAPSQMDLFEDKLLSKKARLHHKLVGQVFDTFLIVEYGDKMFIIDQHAAHEKVLFERTMERYRKREMISQELNPPMILHLSMREGEMVKRYREEFLELGYDIEEFGGDDYAVHTVPYDLYHLAKEDVLMEMIDSLDEEGGIRGKSERLLDRIATMSCKAAVKGNNRLSPQEADALIEELLTLENPYNCPHGRPTIISMTKYELEKKFKRIV